MRTVDESKEQSVPAEEAKRRGQVQHDKVQLCLSFEKPYQHEQEDIMNSEIIEPHTGFRWYFQEHLPLFDERG